MNKNKFIIVDSQLKICFHSDLENISSWIDANEFLDMKLAEIHGDEFDRKLRVRYRIKMN